MKKCSLLYRFAEEGAFDIGESVADLSVDRAARRFCSDARHSERFIDVVSRPLCDERNVKFRQEIAADLLDSPPLAAELGRLFSRYDRIQDDWIAMRAEYHGSASEDRDGGSASARLERIFASLRATSVFPRTILSFVGALHEALGRFPPKSEGLRAVRDYCAELLDGGKLSLISEIASKFSDGEASEYDYRVALKLGVDLSQAEPTLSAVCRRKNENKGLLSLFKKNTSLSPLDTEESEGVDYALSLLADALGQVDSALSALTGEIYELFCGLSTELTFYEAALDYFRFAESKGAAPVFPEVLPQEDETLILRGARDLHLLCEGLDASTVIPNDALLEDGCDGILIRGDNNTGKTVFLRSVGTAQLFAQAGLPVLAQEAKISIRSGIYSHFSSAEEEFMQGDTAGRFEGEVRKVAAIIDRLRDHSLLLLNETFQTTAYAEGAEGMRGILSYLPKAGCRFIFVTHLGAMFQTTADDPLSELNVLRLRTAPGYKLEKFDT